MPCLLWQRRLSHREHAEAVEREFYQAAEQRRRTRKIPALEAPQTRHFNTEPELRAFVATLRATHPDVAITVTPDRPKPPSPAQSRLDEVSDELWPFQLQASDWP